MSKQKKKSLVPVLRFPEFHSERNWEFEKLGTIFADRQDKGFDHLPLLSLTDKDGIIPQEEINRKNNSSSDKSKYLRVCPGDVAYNTMRMWEGRSAYVDIEGLVSPAYTVCKPSNETNGLFFSYYFKTQQLIREFHRYSQGLVKDTLNLKYESFSRIEAPVPLPAEQQKIADCLTSIDELITAQTQKLDALKAHKKGLMQKLFPAEGETVPKLRFPEFREAGEWEQNPLSALIRSLDAGVSVNSGDRPANNDESGILKTNAVTGSVFDPSENKVVTDIEELRRIKEPVLKNTIIISRMNTPALVGANAYIEASHENLFLPDRLWAAKPKSGTSMRFIAYILGGEQGRAALSALATGTSGSMKNISKSAVLEMQVLTPSAEEQKKIADCLASIDELISNQAKKVDAFKAHKKGLMQQLFPAMDKVSV